MEVKIKTTITTEYGGGVVVTKREGNLIGIEIELNLWEGRFLSIEKPDLLPSEESGLPMSVSRCRLTLPHAVAAEVFYRELGRVQEELAIALADLVSPS